jgi:hypothetical protein
MSSGPGMAVNICRKSVSWRRLPVFANNNAIEWKSIGALDALIEGTSWSQCMTKRDREKDASPRIHPLEIKKSQTL